MKVAKLILWGGVLASSFLFIGCSELDTPTSTVSNPDLFGDQHIYIYISAQNHPNTMPFAGQALIWVSPAPVADPTQYEPYGGVGWSEDDPNPMIYKINCSGYLYWRGEQVIPSNEDWETTTRWYSDYTTDDEDYYGHCVFREN